MVFLNALGAMASITILVAIGFVITRKGWVSPDTEAFMPKLLIKVVIPPYLMGNVCAHFQKDQLLGIMAGAVVPFASMCLCYLLFRAIARLCRVDARHRGIFAVAATLSNTIFIGFPVNTALFGEVALPYCLVYFFANTIFFWTVGAYTIAGEGAGHDRRPSLSEVLRRILSMPLLGMVTGIAIVLCGFTLPKVLLDTCGYLGNLSVPLSLIYVGVILYRANWKAAHMKRDVAICVAGRVFASPLIIATLLHFLGFLPFVDLPPLMEKVFIIQSGLPVMLTVSIYAGYMEADKTFASLIVAMTTVAGMLSVPLWMTAITCLM